MSVPSLGSLLCRLRRLIDRRDCLSPTDADLLARFTAERDEAAFELLVWRHGPPVFRLCRRMLRREQDAEDAFQATFLTLARRAAAIGKRESVASWLYKVAYRIVLRLRQRQDRRRALPLDGQPEPPARLEHQGPEADVRAALDEEVSLLPDKYRAAVVLCYLEGKTNSQAAAKLGCPRGTIDSRLAWARERLRQRLQRRGVGMSAPALLIGLAGPATSAELPAALAGTTAHLAVQFAGGAAGLGSVPSIFLARGVLRAMFLGKLKTLFAAVTVTAFLAAGSWGLLPSSTAEAQDGPPAIKLGSPPPSAPTEPAAEVKSLRGHEQSVWSVAFSPDGQFLVSGAGSAAGPGELCLWDVATGRLRSKVHTEKAVRSVAFSPDGKLIASAELDGTVKVRDGSAGGKVVVTLRHPVDGVNVVRFSPEGKVVATGCNDKAIRLWDMEGNQLRALEGADATSAVAFSPDGRRIVGGQGPSVAVWDIQSGRAVAKLAAHTGSVESVAVAPDGKVLVTAGEDKTVRLWDGATGKELRVLNGHTQAVLGVAVSPDGRLIASSSGPKAKEVPAPGEVIVWDAATGKQIAALRGHKDRVGSVAFSPDGKWLASASADGTVRLWSVVPERPGRAAAREIVADRLDQLLNQLLESKRSDEQVLEGLYLATLGRLPTEGEKRRIADLKGGGDRQAHYEEVLRALAASKECRDHQEALRQRSGVPGRP
jgi:RNA polymerase sigma factor (sigma-70 family)